MTKSELIVVTSNLINSKKIITPDIKQKLFELGFQEIMIGVYKKHEINSREMKVDFLGYDLAVGLAARAISYGSGRKYYALVIKLKNS